MKLSDTVALLNLLDSLDIADKCHTAKDALSHITHIVTEHAESYYPARDNIIKTYGELAANITKFSAQIETLKQDVRSEIIQHEQEYIDKSLHLYLEEMIHDTADFILSRRLRINDEDDLKLRACLKNLTDWRLPGMIIRPGVETYIEDMVPLDPLYVVDHHLDLLTPAVSKFTPEYQRRLRQYIIHDWSDGPILGQLPDNQFGVIFAYHYFNHKPLSIIYKFLTEFYEKLRPGGSLLMTYNNCDLANGVIRAEDAWMSYTPRRLIEQYAIDLGFELIDAYDGQGDVSWIELKKSGDIASIRGGQTLAKALAKT